MPTSVFEDWLAPLHAPIARRQPGPSPAVLRIDD
jgi:hypothetical protein